MQFARGPTGHRRVYAQMTWTNFGKGLGNMIGSHRIARDADRSRRAETVEQWKITPSPTPGCMLARASNPVATMAFQDVAPLPPHNLLAHLGRATAGQGDLTGPDSACEVKGAVGTPTELVAHGESEIE